MNDRQLKEIAFNLLYVNFFAHGTDGDNAKRIVASFAEEAGYELGVDTSSGSVVFHLYHNNEVVLELPQLA